MKKYLLLIIFVSFFVKTSFSQTDKDFWFVAPEVAQAAQDRPIFLRMSTVGLASTVTISQPANAGFIPIVVNIPANSTVSQDLTSRITMIESGSPTPGLVENKGLHIVATQNITAYYEVLGTGVVTWVSPYNGQTRVLNSDIFALKGKNALGTRFYTPFQNQLPNCNNNIGTSVVAYSAFDIVATVDNTVITITPTQDVYRTATTWRTAGTAYTVTLNRGQTYSGRARSQSGAGHLSGTLITSNNPIAVTIKDDSILQNMSMDLAGDQLVPVNVIGTEYIVIKGNVNTNGTALGDRAIIVATQANTTVTIGGVLRATLNAGQTLNWQVTQPSEYIVTSQPAYVFHLSGFGDELGGALLPPIACTGSRQVSIFRDTNEPFYIRLLVKTGGEVNFTLKNSSTGATTTISAASFSTVPNTASQWMFADILYSTAIIPSGSSNLISNSTSDFHAGCVNGEATEAGCRYGYFSDFNGLLGGTTIVAASPICSGSSTTINLTGSVGNIQWQQSSNSVSWGNVSGGSGSTTTIYTTPNLTATTYYRAMLTNGSCNPQYSDTALVTVTSATAAAAGSPQSLCATTAVLGGNEPTAGTGVWSLQSGTGAITNTTLFNSGVTGLGIGINVFRWTITNSPCTPSSSDVTITRNSCLITADFTVSTTSTCIGSANVTFTDTSTGATGYTWDFGAGASPAKATGIGPHNVTYSASGFKTISLIVTGPGGTDTRIKTNYILVSAMPTTSNAGPNQSVCATTATLAGNNPTVGTGIWTLQSGAGTITSVNAYNSGLTALGVGANVFRWTVANGSCASSSDDVTITLYSVTAGGTVDEDSVVCSGFNFGNLTLSGYTGSIVRWESSTDNFATITNIPNTGTTQSYNNLTATTRYRVIVQSGTCSSANSLAATITVDPVTVGGTATAANPTICGNTSTTISLSGSTGSIQWQQSADGSPGSWVNVTGGSGGTTSTYTTPNLSTTTYYKALLTSGTCASQYSDTALVIVSPVPVGGTATAANSSICGNASTTISVIGSTGSIQWQQSDGSPGSWVNVTGGSGGTTATYTTPNLSITTYYRVVVKSGVCAAANSSIALVIIYTPSVGGTAIAFPASICYNTTTNVTLTGYNGNIQWQQSNDTTIASNWIDITGATTDVLVTPNLKATTYYRAIVTNAGCPLTLIKSSIATVMVKAKVNFSLRSDTLICQGTEFFIKAPSGFTDYTWQDNSKGSQYLVLRAGTYIVKAVAPNGCIVTDTVVISNCNKNFLPDIFTPNKDGKNEYFVIQGILPNSSLAVYNRWGTLVYSSDNYDNSWDGEGATDGIYYYIYHKNGEAPIPGWIDIAR